ncbi:MAG: YitT family protein [Blautia sp.]|nr:YitT family protein [Blautia sp.]MDY3998978.1 YitT family protein [Blautia sp.]
MSRSTSLKNIKIKNLCFLTLAGIINAIGVSMFLAPVNLYDSGISGTSILLSQLTPEYMSLSVFLLILNIPLFLYGLKRQGLLFTVYAIYAVLIYSVSAWMITDVLPVDVAFASPLAGQDLLLCAVFGGFISGMGSGLAIRSGGAMDGIEVMAVIFAKRMGITVGSFVMIYNICLYIICGIVIESWILPLYSIVAYAAAVKTVDFMVEGFDRAKCAVIITVKPTEICLALSEAFECGMTKISAVGGYSNKEKTMIYFVVNRFQITKMKDIVHEIDPSAYITISEVTDVFSANMKAE